MAEHIPLPGAPQIIVTRAFAYDLLVRWGYPPIGGFGSVDYMVFGGRNLHASTEPLTDLDQPWVRDLLDRMRKEC